MTSRLPDHVSALLKKCQQFDYKKNARDPNEKNCIGLMLFIEAELGFYMPDWEEDSVLAFTDTPGVFVSKYDGILQPIELTSLQLGDIILFASRRNQYVRHVAVAIDRCRFIHTGAISKVCIHNIDDQPYCRMNLSALRPIQRLETKTT